MMLSYEDQRKAIAIFIMGVILVLICTIVVLVFIWIPDKKVKIEYEVGKINEDIMEEKDVVNKYYDRLSNLLSNNDIDGIYNLLGEDYKEFSQLDTVKLKEYLIEKNILSKSLELVEYTKYIISGYNNVYSVDIKVVDEAYSINVIIREKSPEQYTIAFDKFIDRKTNVHKSTIDSIEMNVYERTRYTTNVEYKYTLKNNYNKDIIVNSGSSALPILLVSAQGNVKRPVVSDLTANENVMHNNESLNGMVVFGISETSDYMHYNTLVLKNVKYSGIEGVTDLQYIISN